LLISSVGYRNVEVLDMADDVVALAQARGIPATITDDTAAWLDGQEGSIDAVLLLHVLEHVPKPEIIRLLSAVRRSLRHDGRLLLEVPNMGDPLNGLYFRYSDFTHEVGFTEESLNYVLRQAGFDQIRYLAQAGASRRTVRAAQRVSRTALHGVLYVVNLPNGRQMRRRIGPVLSVCATP
jgi:SAM-dependent methyltransferase